MKHTSIFLRGRGRRSRRRVSLLLFSLCACCVAAVATAAEPADLAKLDNDPHLMGWWKFEETKGTAAADSSKHGRAAKLSGSMSFDKSSVPGRVGKALQFDGGEDVAQVTGYKGVTGTSPRTISLWIKTKATKGELVSWGTRDMGQMWNFCFIRRHLGINNGGYYYMAHEVEDDKWHHVAVVVQEADLPNLHDDVTLFLDGKIAEIHRIGLLDLWPIETGDELDVAIGRKFQGAVDELRIYDRALSEEEIGALHAVKD